MAQQHHRQLGLTWWRGSQAGRGRPYRSARQVEVITILSSVSSHTLMLRWPLPRHGTSQHAGQVIGMDVVGVHIVSGTE